MVMPLARNALRDARADACHTAVGDPVVTAAGWSFIALGA
jgi:hypothetical protein